MPKFTLHISGRNNFIWLLGGLVFFLFVGAIADQYKLEHTNRFVNVALMIMLVGNIWCVDNPRTNILGWKAGATFIISTTMITDTIISSNILAEFQLFMTFLFLILTTWQAWNQVLFTGRVDQNKIIGAICIYLLLGLLWAFAYLIAETYYPGSMNGLEHDQWQYNTGDLVYYSLVTLTTLGYGDITPDQPITKFLAYMEAVIGIFYTTILVASLIGIRLSGVDSRKTIEQLEEEAEAAEVEE